MPGSLKAFTLIFHKTTQIISEIPVNNVPFAISSTKGKNSLHVPCLKIIIPPVIFGNLRSLQMVAGINENCFPGNAAGQVAA